MEGMTKRPFSWSTATCIPYININTKRPLVCTPCRAPWTNQQSPPNHNFTPMFIKTFYISRSDSSCTPPGTLKRTSLILCNSLSTFGLSMLKNNKWTQRCKVIACTFSGGGLCASIIKSIIHRYTYLYTYFIYQYI